MNEISLGNMWVYPASEDAGLMDLVRQFRQADAAARQMTKDYRNAVRHGPRGAVEALAVEEPQAWRQRDAARQAVAARCASEGHKVSWDWCAE